MECLPASEALRKDTASISRSSDAVIIASGFFLYQLGGGEGEAFVFCRVKAQNSVIFYSWYSPDILI